MKNEAVVIDFISFVEVKKSEYIYGPKEPFDPELYNYAFEFMKHNKTENPREAFYLVEKYKSYRTKV